MITQAPFQPVFAPVLRPAVGIRGESVPSAPEYSGGTLILQPTTVLSTDKVLVQ